jgi:hypothetical protein
MRLSFAKNIWHPIHSVLDMRFVLAYNSHRTPPTPTVIQRSLCVAFWVAAWNEMVARVARVAEMDGLTLGAEKGAGQTSTWSALILSS